MIGVRLHTLTLAGLTTALFAGACSDNNDLDDQVPPGQGSAEVPPTTTTGFQVTTLVTNQTDADLINAWGICSMQGLFFIADNGTGKISVFDGQGRTSTAFPTGTLSLGAGITGISCMPATATPAFQIPCDTTGQTFGPANLVVASEKGTIIAANAETPPQGVVVVDLSSTGAVFKGVTRADTANGPVLLAADFVNARVDVFDTNFKQVVPAAGTVAPFNDPQLPAGWGPFNVQTRGDRVFVMEAKIGTGGDEEKGAGLGAVAVFDLNGTLLARITSASFNAPWGIALVPASSTLTTGSDTLFIGNFGDGHITEFNSSDLRELGQLTDINGNVIAIDGLWGLEVGSAAAGNPNDLYFTGGPNDEMAGIFGRIERVTQTTQPTQPTGTDEPEGSDEPEGTSNDPDDTHTPTR